MKRRSSIVSKLIDGEPTILVEIGKILRERLRHARSIEADLLEAARLSQGIETLGEIKFAILERNGTISVIPEIIEALRLSFCVMGSLAGVPQQQ